MKLALAFVVFHSFPAAADGAGGLVRTPKTKKPTGAPTRTGAPTATPTGAPTTGAPTAAPISVVPSGEPACPLAGAGPFPYADTFNGGCRVDGKFTPIPSFPSVISGDVGLVQAGLDADNDWFDFAIAMAGTLTVTFAATTVADVRLQLFKAGDPRCIGIGSNATFVGILTAPASGDVRLNDVGSYTLLVFFPTLFTPCAAYEVTLAFTPAPPV